MKERTNFFWKEEKTKPKKRKEKHHSIISSVFKHKIDILYRPGGY